MKLAFIMSVVILFGHISYSITLDNELQITAGNRQYSTPGGSMGGGWGPHLRSIMKSSAGDIWYADDAGPSVSSNTSVRYFKIISDIFGNKSWSQESSQAFGAGFGIQQNTAQVMQGNYILTYGIDIANNRIMECYFDTTNYSYKGCNAIWVGGSVQSVPPYTNYIGAALTPSGYRVVWWTTTNQANPSTPGTFSYIYNFGSGWNGPINTSLSYSGNNYVHLSYVHMFFKDNNNAEFVGETFNSPSAYSSFAGHITLGSQISNVEFLGGEYGQDMWYQSSNGSFHCLVYGSSGGSHVDYYYKSSGGTWMYVQSFANTWSARFVEDQSTGTLHLITGSDQAVGSGISVRSISISSISSYVNWNSISPTTIAQPPIPSSVSPAAFLSPPAIYNQSRAYQTSSVSGFFGAIGGTGYDNYAWSFQFH